MPVAAEDSAERDLSQEDLEKLKPLVFPEEDIKEELSKPGVTQEDINAILSDKLAKIQDTGDFSMKQLREA